MNGHSTPCESRLITIPAPLAGERLDRALAQADPELSRAAIQRLLKEGAVTRLDGSLPQADDKAVAGESFQIRIPAPQPIAARPEAIPLDVVYEDDDIIVINKPAGLAVHAGAGRVDGVLVNALLHHCGGPERTGGLSGIGGAIRPGIVHRLDMETSGLLVAAKNDRAHLHLADQFAAHTAARRYLAVVRGLLSATHGTIDAPIGRHPRERQKMAVEPRHGRAAITHWQRQETCAGFTVVACRLETGRTHQIRVHMAHLGHPLLGDPLYARPFHPPSTWPEESRAVVTAFRRQALHAAQLTILHPTRLQEMIFSVDPPEDLQTLLAALREVDAKK
ncbi:MAG: RluA family pseudouridine synthase [Magnetococcales bacterium]|nr:RluA family pseudouridine synthase [Magnetococcales bacterium]NGZ04882.1 RluA family pseudouridine synthase [Magnetococcales bacterium]